MSSDDDIRRPVMPLTEQEDQERKGFLGMFSQKKQKEPTEVTMLKERLETERQRPSPQRAFEELVAQEEEAPAPPPQFMAQEQTPPLEEEEAPAPPETIMQAEQEEKPTIKRLEEQLASLKTQARDHFITFTIMGGKRAVTLKDLEKVIQQMPPEEFERRHADKELSLWVKTHLFDNDLAGKLQEATTKQQALQAINEELKPRTKAPTAPEPPKRHENHVEEHFSTLQATHEQTMQELAKAVQQPAAAATKDYLKQALKTKDGRVAEQFNDLIEAVGLLQEETYRNMLATRKEDFIEHLKRLAQQAARISQLNPAQLQASIVDIIKQQGDQLSQAINQEGSILAEQASQLLQKEDDIIKQEQSLQESITTMEQAGRQLTQQQEAWELDVKKREEAILSREREAERVINKQEMAIATLKEEMASREQANKEQELAIEEKKKELREEELGIAEKKRLALKDVEEEKARLEEAQTATETIKAGLKEKEEQLLEDKQAFEEAMQKRERLVQETVDKIVGIDEDINDQREKIVKMKRELDSEGFKTYLQRTLRNINTDHIQFKPLHEEENLRKKHLTIYGKIDSCNDAIENRQLAEAKRLYAELKDSFEREPLEQEEKDILYDAIREIYANLHLALLQGNS